MIRQLNDRHLSRIYRASSFAGDGNVGVLERGYDVCVIGSGPGGAVAACTLAQAGLNTVLVERGPFFAPDEFNFRVLDMSNRHGRLELTDGFRTLLYQGNGVGGGSLVFGAVAMQPPPFVFDEWREVSRLDDLTFDQLLPHYQHVGQVMSVTQQGPELENAPNGVIREMAKALGRPEGLERVQRYTQGCAGVGMCNFGCGLNLKGTMLNSFVPLGLDTGNLTLLTDAEAIGLGGESGSAGYHAQGVGLLFRDFESGRILRRAFLKCRKVVLAAGSFFSSGLLLKTGGLPGKDRIGRKIYLQPHAQVFAMFDRPMTSRGVLDGNQYLPHNGVPAIYEFTGMLREWRYFWLASILFPANLAAFVSNLPAAEHYEIMKRFHYAMSLTLTIRDDPERSRIHLKQGRPHLQFRESSRDIEALRKCFLHAAQGFLAAGARRVFLPLLQPLRIESKSDLAKIERLHFEYKDLLLYSDHTSGGNGLAAGPERGVTDSTGRIFDTENVFVADSSLFPTAPGVNPSWSIMALSRRVALNLV